VLSGFEDLSDLFQFLELTFCLLEFLFLLNKALSQAVDLVKHYFDRGLLLPRLSSGLGS
jgi:hypothetical protein